MLWPHPWTLIYAYSLLLIPYFFSEHAEGNGYGVVERFVGHGVGQIFHSEPLILHHRKLAINSSICFILLLLT